MKKNVTPKLQQIKRMEEELTTLFGEKSYVVIRKPCSGKYHGHNDYTIVFAPDRVAHCFFIVNYLHKKEAIRDQAEYYLDSQCRSYEFFGEYRAQWELTFDDVDIDFHPDVDSDDIALTMAWEKMDCFVDALALELAISDRAESNIYLLYDDKEVFEKVLEMLNEIMQQENLNRL